MLLVMERRIIQLALGRKAGNYEVFIFAVALIITLVKYISRRSKIT
jgi:hypothetical protein